MSTIDDSSNHKSIDLAFSSSRRSSENDRPLNCSYLLLQSDYHPHPHKFDFGFERVPFPTRNDHLIPCNTPLPTPCKQGDLSIFQ
ncbi:hypothetical protein AVEN_100388-1 [Araneus ventricosus]|uniref:Uncharacterized protein n=1 Tax=Araneus ventricosus TaxID=182803 RepID=A0A4Y2Q079_ARAVE|nr:hypothetical protein AVEN_100388-1 [Araneus ventricosus]